MNELKIREDGIYLNDQKLKGGASNQNKKHGRKMPCYCLLKIYCQAYLK